MGGLAFGNMGDADLEAAIRASLGGAAPSQSGAASTEQLVASLMEMGFERAQCEQAAQHTQGVEQAMEWIFAHPDGADSAPPPAPEPSEDAAMAQYVAGLTRIQVARPGYKDGETNVFSKEGKAFLYRWSERNDQWEVQGEVSGIGSGSGGQTLGASMASIEQAAEKAENATAAEPGAEDEPQLSLAERKARIEEKAIAARAARE